MADIKDYQKEKERRERQRLFEKKQVKHRLTRVYRILLGIVGVLAVVGVVYLLYKQHRYTSYDILAAQVLESSSRAEKIRLRDSVLTYSKDGAHCTNAKGEVVWNQTYEMQDILLSSCRDVVAIGSYNGREIYIQSTEKQLGTVTTTMPIRSIAVAATGRVAVVLSDTDVTWVNIYEPDGKLCFNGQFHMQESGYPAAISLSPNGVLLAVSFVYIDAGEIKTNMAFYNFGPVGENMRDLMVSNYSYTDMIIPEVRFVDDQTAVAVGDSQFIVYKGNQRPMQNSSYMYNREMRSVYHGDKYVGLVLPSDDMEHSYMLDVYNTDGKKVDSYYFDVEYTDILLEEDYFVIYNESECLIMTYGGLEKFNGYFSKAVDLLIPAQGAYKYLLVTENSIDLIQLK